MIPSEILSEISDREVVSHEWDGGKLILRFAPKVDKSLLGFMAEGTWIARDKSGSVYLYDFEPDLDTIEWNQSDNMIEVSVDPFPADLPWDQCIYKK